MKMVFIKFKPDGKEYGFGVPEDYKGSAGLKPGSWVRVPVPGCRKRCCGWWCVLQRPKRRRKA